MEYTTEFGAILIAILLVAIVFWGIHWKNEVTATFSQRKRLKGCRQLAPIQFSTTRRTDVITIKSLRHTTNNTEHQVQVRKLAAQRR